MSSAVALVVFPLLLQSVQATFPPVLNPPPIPSQAVRSVDISGQRFYLQDDLQPNQPQNVIKEDGYISPDDKIDPRWFATENQSGETGDFPNTDDTFDRYYANGLPAVGPVATPLPDDNYVAQPSVTSKVIPDSPANVGSSDIWVLTKGPNDQLIPERWVQVQIPQIQVPQVQVQVPQDRVVEVVKSDIAPKQYTESVKSFPPPPPPPPPVKAPIVAPPPNVVQQIWVRAPVPIQSQKGVQNTPTVVEEFPSVKQYVDIPPPAVKQYVQPQFIKEAQPLPPPPPPPPTAVVQKSSSFVLPPPPPPPIKGTDLISPKQAILVNQPVPAPVIGDQVVTVGKNVAVPQVKHIWIPTSPQTGKFITVPVGTTIDGGKSVPAKGVPVDVPGPPISVSETWVLKQDGPLPRFEEQKTVVPVVQKGNIIVDSSPKIQFDSPKNPPLIGKSIDTAVPLDIWPSKNTVPEQAIVGKFAIPPPPPPPSVFPPPIAAPIKSDAVVVSKSAPIAPPPQKTIISNLKGFPQLPPSLPPPPPQIVAPVPQIINGKPCPIVPQKFSFPPRTVPVPSFRTVAINRPPLGRIMRINRYPYGSYYVLNQRIAPSLYPYPRPPVIQQTKNGVVRLVTANQVAVPLQPRQLAVPVARKQVVVPVSNVKSAAPVLLYPPVSRIRYAYPWGSYIRSLPVTAGKNIFVLPPNKPAKIQAAKKSSSSESSSSESSSSESKSVEIKPKSKEAKKSEEIKAESIESIESEEPVPEPEPEVEPEREIEEVETAASEAEPETEEAPVESEAKDSIEVEESQVKPQFFNRAYVDSNTDNIDLIRKPFLFNFDQIDNTGTTQHRKEVSDANGRVVGSYGYHNSDGIYRKVAYVADADGYRARVLSNEPGTVSHSSANVNFVANVTPENTTNKISEIANAASHENLTIDPQRD
ncbi:uncharacterized protein NPIL_198091 [Nephila pilipes]|uniref:Cuticular protein n=1 Tax=Nephila pilipes TaxID=299642 RepID=A0A8X6TBD7_NEPPI|nr:uncharacterized protein NPIL_198091 [Nephila pilipes]